MEASLALLGECLENLLQVWGLSFGRVRLNAGA